MIEFEWDDEEELLDEPIGVKPFDFWAVLSAQLLALPEHHLTCAGFTEDNLLFALGMLWEHEVYTPIIVMNPFRIKDLIGCTNLQMRTPSLWVGTHRGKFRSTFEGRILDCDVHADPHIRRDVIIITDLERDPVQSTSVICIV